MLAQMPPLVGITLEHVCKELTCAYTYIYGNASGLRMDASNHTHEPDKRDKSKLCMWI